MSTMIPMLDTHQHLVYPDKWPYSWTDDIPALAKRGFRYEDYTKLVEQEGVAGTIFMETSPDDPHWRQETKFVYSLAEKPGSLIEGVIANCRPEESGFQGYVDSVRHKKLVGFRRILHVVPDDVSRNPGFGENVRWLGKQNLTFDLCFLRGNFRSQSSWRQNATAHSSFSTTAACRTSLRARSIHGERISAISRSSRMLCAKSPACWPIASPVTRRSTQSGRMSSIASTVSARIGWSGVAIGRSS